MQNTARVQNIIFQFIIKDWSLKVLSNIKACIGLILNLTCVEQIFSKQFTL